MHNGIEKDTNTSAETDRGDDPSIFRIPIVEQIDTSPEVKRKHIFNLDPEMLNEAGVNGSGWSLKISTNLPISFALQLSYDPNPIDRSVGVIYAAVVLFGLYVMIIWEIVHRTFAAIVASTMSIALLAMMNERPQMAQIMQWIDVETLLLLFGMMILVALLSETGVFDYLAVYAYKVSAHVLLSRACLNDGGALIPLDHKRTNLAFDKLLVPVHGGDVVVPRQRDDRAADDPGHHPAVRGDAAEPGADSDVDDHLLQHR